MNLAVIETRWWQTGNHSVRGLFDVLWDILEPGTRYHYEMFVDRNSLRSILTRIMELNRQPHIRHLYIAGHGDNDGIHAAEGHHRISRGQLCNDLLECIPNRESHRRGGLYVSSCQFVNDQNVCFMFDRDVASKLRWIAGYSTTVDWIDSSLSDMLFWNTYYHSNENTEIRKIAEVGSRINSFMPGAFHELGFQIYLFERGDVRPLLS